MRDRRVTGNKKPAAAYLQPANVSPPLFDQKPLAVIDLDHYPGAIVHAVMVLRIQVEDAVGAGHLLGAFEGVAQRRAKRFGARRRFFQRLRDRALQ